MRIITLGLIFMTTIAMKAQWYPAIPTVAPVNDSGTAKGSDTPASHSSLLYQGQVWYPKPDVVFDKKAKKKVAVWGDTENNSWHEKIGEVKEFALVKDIESIFDGYSQLTTTTPYMPMRWMLMEENDQTVLHCYLTMPADKVQNLWLASSETAILDMETGITYRSRSTVPEACYNKVFDVKSAEGTTIDLQIIFPKLPKKTKEIAIYGVPNWGMRGSKMTLYRGLTPESAEEEGYDVKPVVHEPHLVSEAKDYDKDNHQSWAVYNDAHLIKPVTDGTLAIWLTPDATILAEACEMNWNREYFGRGGANILLDKNGHQYKCKDVIYYPNNNIFWNEGISGDFFAIFSIYEPLPLYTENVTMVVPEGEPFAMWGANWSGSVKQLNIKDLRQNQKLFEYHPRVVVK